MSDEDAQPHDLDEIRRLVTALAEQMLASEISTCKIDPVRAKALIGAVQFLDDHDVSSPPAVQQALSKIRAPLGAP